MIAVVMTVLVLLLSAACSMPETPPEPELKIGVLVMEISSPDFPDGEPIPVQFTCDGEDASPRLEWGGAPETAVSYALIVEDLDAPGGYFTHWLVYDIPASFSSLPGNLPAEPRFEDGTTQGRNSFGGIGYGGPCPPRGSDHRYVFTIYALDKTLGLPAGASKGELLDGMEDHALAKEHIIGTYRR